MVRREKPSRLWLRGPYARTHIYRYMRYILHSTVICEAHSEFVIPFFGSCCCFRLLLLLFLCIAIGNRGEPKQNSTAHSQHRTGNIFPCDSTHNISNLLRSPFKFSRTSNISIYTLGCVVLFFKFMARECLNIYNLFGSINFSIECHKSCGCSTKYDAGEPKSFWSISGIFITVSTKLPLFSLAHLRMVNMRNW